MKKFQIKCDSVQKVLEEVKKLPPKKKIAIIRSQGFYYIEDIGAFVRINEELIYEGVAGKVPVK